MSQPRIDYRVPTSVRKSPNLYTESSIISQYLAHSKKIYDSPQSSHKKTHNNHNLNHIQREYRGLAKNFYQNKYLLLLEGNSEQRAGWRRCLVDGFKQRVSQILEK